MRRGGNWSWKWFAINTAAWFGTLWTAVEAGSYFEVDFFVALKAYKLNGLLGMLATALVLSPGTFFVVKILNGAIHRKLEELARNEQKVSINCRLIADPKKFNEYQIKIVREANEYLFATGSRSRNAEYLGLIEKRLKASEALAYTRILFGEIRRDELTQHCTRLVSDPKVTAQVRICEITDLARHTEAFIVINECEALVVIPSLNAMGKFDTGLVMRGAMHARVRNIVESYERAASPWKPIAGATP